MAEDVGSLVVRVGMDSTMFQKGVTGINKQMQLMKSEFQATSSKVKDFGNGVEGLKGKADYLNRVIELQNQKVKKLAEGYQKTKEETGEYSNQTIQAGIALNRAITTLNNMEKELKESSREIDRQTSKWKKLSESMAGISSKMKSVGNALAGVGRGLSAAITLPLLGVGTAATNMAMDAVESENLFEVSMGKMADSARKWSEETSKALGLNAYSVRKSVSTYNVMLDSMGLSEKEAYKMATAMTQLSYDMASFYNLKPEEAFEKLKSGISGEAEPLKALGILVNDNTIKTYAYTHGIAKQGKELTEQQKVMARYGVIMEQTSKAQGDLARTADSPTNKIRRMKEQIAELGIKVGNLLIPVLEKLINIISPVIDKLQSMSEEQRKTSLIVAGFVAAIGPVLIVVGHMVTAFGAISGVFSKLSLAVANAGGLMAVLKGAFAAITGPVGIAVAVIGVLAASFVRLYKNNENFREKVNEVWDQIKTFIVEVCDIIKEYWVKWGDDIKGIFTGLMDALKPILFLILGVFQVVWPAIANIVKVVVNNIGNILGGMIRIIRGIVDFVAGVLTLDWKRAWEGIKNIFGGIWDTISGMAKGAIDLIVGTIEGLISGIKKALEWLGILKKEDKAVASNYDPRTYARAGRNLPAYAVGTPYVPYDQVAMIHEGEMIVPKKYNPNAGGQMGAPVNQNITVTVPVNLDGQQIAKVVTPGIDTMSGKKYKLSLRGAGV